MDTLAVALGVDAVIDELDITGIGDVRLETAGAARDAQILAAMTNLRVGLQDELGDNVIATACAAESARVHRPAAVVGASFLTDDGGEAKTRAAAARTLLDQYRDWRLFRRLTASQRDGDPRGGVIHHDVSFVVATVPDYVDSNSGWLADQNLAAIQSAMANRSYLFDRVKLIDWSRSADVSAAVSGSHLHERQPGAMIFRAVQGTKVSLLVVLLVLETPTAGVHQTALRNSLRFVRAWNTCVGVKNPGLRVLGPTFSGSIVSLSSVLGESARKRWFSRRLVITGSANADGNRRQMNTFGGTSFGRTTYRRTLQPMSVLRRAMAEFLSQMNPDWRAGQKVAMLTESNTAYGQGESEGFFPEAASFAFPLHVAQLRSDAPTLSQPGTALFNSESIPLNLRELTPPTDLLPALKPHLTSPVVEATVASIFDTIRHEKYTAVGIVATDDRDVLFLARELRRASPDVQLFLFGTHALYLHPDYVPYLRGAIVATSYSLSLANQPEVVTDGLTRQQREPFQSMAAEGIYHATRALVADSQKYPGDQSGVPVVDIPYCSTMEPESFERWCVAVAPPSINGIGEDGYWTLSAASESTATATVLTSASPMQLHPLPPLPRRMALGAAFIVLFVLTHVAVLFKIRRERLRPGPHPFLELPFVRVLAPPRTVKDAAFYHRLALTVCFGLLGLAMAWVAAIVLPFVLRGEAVRNLIPLLSVLSLGGVISAAFRWYGPAHLPIDNGASGTERRSISAGRTMGLVLLVGMLATIVLLALETFWLIVASTRDPQGGFVLARLVGGGILSPAILTVGILAALYTAAITGIRRLSLVGHGYASLSRNSSAFALMRDAASPDSRSRESRPVSEDTPTVGDRRPDGTSQLAAVLDMPAPNLPTVYVLLVVLALAIGWVGAWQISTLDGRLFSWFVRIGSLTALGVGLLLLVQGLATWNTARSRLKGLAQSPIAAHLKEVAPHVPWEISLAPPRLAELLPVARMADDLLREFRHLTLSTLDRQGSQGLRRDVQDFSPYRSSAERSLGVRKGDLTDLTPLFAPPSHVDDLRHEMTTQWQQVSLIQSTSWVTLWRLSDAVVNLMARKNWQRTESARATVSVERSAPEAIGAGSSLTGWQVLREAQLEAAVQRARKRGADFRTTDSAGRADWFSRCEQFVALQMAFVVRDIVARTITCLFAAMLCLTLLAGAHLFYAFNGRASMLTVDMLAVAVAALSSVWILVDMERDQVLSRLRSTDPGRVNMNWDFMRRIAIYGVLPLLVVLAALFPEVGGTLFGWLEPLRKLSSL